MSIPAQDAAKKRRYFHTRPGQGAIIVAPGCIKRNYRPVWNGVRRPVNVSGKKDGSNCMIARKR